MKRAESTVDLRYFRPISAARRRRERFPWYFDMSSAAVLVVSVALISLVSLLYLIQTSQIATTGYELGRLDLQKEELLREQQQLQYQVSQFQNLGQIEAAARDRLGMGRPMTSTYLPVLLPAQGGEMKAGGSGVPSPGDANGQNLWDELSSQYTWASHGQTP